MLIKTVVILMYLRHGSCMTRLTQEGLVGILFAISGAGFTLLLYLAYWYVPSDASAVRLPKPVRRVSPSYSSGTSHAADPQRVIDYIKRSAPTKSKPVALGWVCGFILPTSQDAG